MAESPSSSSQPASLRRSARPLGMPPGSIRALVAMTVVLVVINETLAGREVSLLISETLLIVLAHYFGSRHATSPSVGAAGPTGADQSHPEPNPLWLPRYAVRGLIIGAFVSTAAYLAVVGRWGEDAAVSNLWIVLAYFAGIAFGLWRRSRPDKRGGRTRLWQHLLGLAMVLVAALLALASFAGRLNNLPESMTKFLMSAVLFYFGSR